MFLDVVVITCFALNGHDSMLKFTNERENLQFVFLYYEIIVEVTQRSLKVAFAKPKF